MCVSDVQTHTCAGLISLTALEVVVGYITDTIPHYYDTITQNTQKERH